MNWRVPLLLFQNMYTMAVAVAVNDPANGTRASDYLTCTHTHTHTPTRYPVVTRKRPTCIVNADVETRRLPGWCEQPWGIILPVEMERWTEGWGRISSSALIHQQTRRRGYLGNSGNLATGDSFGCKWRFLFRLGRSEGGHLVRRSLGLGTYHCRCDSPEFT